MSVNPIPDRYHTVTPYLTVVGATELLQFVQDAFGATEIECIRSPAGRVPEAWDRIQITRMAGGARRGTVDGLCVAERRRLLFEARFPGDRAGTEGAGHQVRPDGYRMPARGNRFGVAGWVSNPRLQPRPPQRGLSRTWRASWAVWFPYAGPRHARGRFLLRQNRNLPLWIP